MVQKSFQPVSIADVVAARMRKRSPARPLPNPGGPGSLGAGPTPISPIARTRKRNVLGMMAGLQKRF